MAAIAPKAFLVSALLSLSASADQPQEILQAINQVAGGLTAGNPAIALIPFDKSYANYVALQNGFIGLTQAYDLTNEADVVDEEDAPGDTLVTLRWTLTKMTKDSNNTSRQSAEIHAHLKLKNGKWKIVEFAPIDLFTP